MCLRVLVLQEEFRGVEGASSGSLVGTVKAISGNCWEAFRRVLQVSRGRGEGF